MFTSPILMS